MSLRGRAVAVALVAAAAAALVALRPPQPHVPEPAVAPPTEPPTRAARPRVLAPRAPTEARTVAPPPEPAEVVAYRARAAEVAQRCGLSADTRCGGAACAAAMAMPDLDRFGGWVRLAVQSPRFVLSTVARDLGVPPRVLPCGAAVSALVGEGTVRTVELAGGDEVWCAIEGDPDEADALCDALAEERAGADAARFSEAGLRQLRFDR